MCISVSIYSNIYHVYLSIQISIMCIYLSNFLSIYKNTQLLTPVYLQFLRIYLSIFHSNHINTLATVYLSIQKSIYLSNYKSCVSFYLSIFQSNHKNTLAPLYLSIQKSIASIYLFIHLSKYLSFLSIYLSIFLSIYKNTQ